MVKLASDGGRWVSVQETLIISVQVVVCHSSQPGTKITEGLLCVWTLHLQSKDPPLPLGKKQLILAAMEKEGRLSNMPSTLASMYG